jgi:transposase
VSSSGSITPLCLDPELLGQLVEKLPAGVIEQLTDSWRKQSEALARSEKENRLLRELLRLMRVEKYGPASERLSDQQLELLEQEPGVSQAEVQAESERAQLRLPLKGPKQGPARQSLPVELPRVEQLIACEAQECVCGACGKEKVVIGYEMAEQLDVEPAKYFVRVTKREKRACPHCPEQGVACAPLPPRIIEKSLASDRLIIETIVNKYADYVPLYRQSAILERDSRVELSRATLCGWVMRVGELLRPISRAMAEELLGGDYLQADETPVGVQMHDGRGQNHQGYLWQYSRPGGVVIFDFQLSRGREGPRRFLGNFEGILQTDGYSGYDRVGGGKLIHAGCWAHARRYFFQAVEAHPDDRAAIALVATIDELFAIDAQAREQNLTVIERHQLRQQKARSILESIKSQIERAKGQTLPKSALAKACNYTLTFWNRLTRFLDHSILELSTNAAENAIRPVALGRKNWIHFGSQEAGPRIAAILSIVETCRRLQIPIRDYLTAILPGLADLPVSRVAELIPTAWAARS